MFGIKKNVEKPKIRFYSHSLIFYFWPLWLSSLAFGFITIINPNTIETIGAAFLLSLLFTIFSIAIDIRGLWVIIFTLFFTIIGFVFEKTGILYEILNSISYLKINIEPKFYFLFGLPLAITWFFTIILYDRRKYVELRSNELTVVKEIGEGVINYDTMGIVFRKKRDNFVQHWIFGLGSGDLVITAGAGGSHKETIYVNNVLRVGSKIKKMHQILETRR